MIAVLFFFAVLIIRVASKGLEPNHMHKQIIKKKKILQIWKFRSSKDLRLIAQMQLK